MTLLLTVLLVVIGAIVLVVISRANELFYVSIRDGRCLLVRGAMPPSLLAELRTVVRMSGARWGSVRAFKDRGRPRIVVSGLGENMAQRVRNAFGARGFHRATATGAAEATCGSRNFGQVLGIAWLAWLMSSRGA